MLKNSSVSAQIIPAAATLTTAYAGGSASQKASGGGATIYGILACETGGIESKIRVSIAVGNATDTLKQYIMYDYPCAANQVVTWNVPIYLGATDVIRVQSDSGTVSFNISGTENI